MCFCLMSHYCRLQITYEARNLLFVQENGRLKNMLHCLLSVFTLASKMNENCNRGDEQIIIRVHMNLLKGQIVKKRST